MAKHNYIAYTTVYLLAHKAVCRNPISYSLYNETQPVCRALPNNRRDPPSKYFAQGCTLSPTLFKVFINDMTRAVETTKQGVKVEDDMVLGLMFADD